MVNPIMRIKIVKIKPSTVGEGRIYDQYVFLQLPDGTIFDVFDFKVLANPEMINKIKNTTISVSLASISKLSPEKFGVDPSQDVDLPTGSGHVFYGKIEEIDEKHYELTVDVGMGTVLVTPDLGELKKYNLGDFVRVLAVRVDLDKILD